MHIDLHVAWVVNLGNLIWQFGSLSLVFVRVTANFDLSYFISYMYLHIILYNMYSDPVPNHKI